MNAQYTLPNVTPIKVSCPDCRLGKLCVTQGLNTEQIEQLNGIVRRNILLQRGEHFFRQGDSFHSLYVVMSGSVKSYVASSDGTEQIIGFYLPGELLGLDAIQTSHHTSSAAALEKVALCEFPYSRFEELCTRIPSLQRQMLAQFSKELTNDHELLFLLGQKSAEERLAIFLLNLSGRFKERGFSSTEYNLSMSRYDIANFLGIAAETVSRAFTHFEKQALLEVDGKRVTINDLQKLRELANCEHYCITTGSSKISM